MMPCSRGRLQKQSYFMYQRLGSNRPSTMCASGRRFHRMFARSTQIALLSIFLCGVHGGIALAGGAPQPRRTTGSPAPKPAARKIELLGGYPGVRVAMGPMWPQDKTLRHVVYSLDVMASGMLSLGKEQTWSPWSRSPDPSMQGLLILIPELGYTYESRGAHLASLGLGLGIRNFVVGVHYVPRFVLGSNKKALALGIRHGVMLEALLGILTLEFAHQVLWTDGQPVHDIRLLAGVDLVRALYIMFTSMRSVCLR